MIFILDFTGSSSCSLNNFQKLNHAKNPPKPEATKNCTSKTKSKLTRNSSISCNDSTSEKFAHVDLRNKKMKTQSVSDLVIGEYFDMKCNLCEFWFSSMRDANLHHRRQHKQTGYLICCDRKFRSSVKVREHCEWHRNPEMFE